jgi:hypothetical protein
VARFGASDKGVLGKWPLFEKSGAKTSLSLASGVETARAQFNKVFLLLFVHKK